MLALSATFALASSPATEGTGGVHAIARAGVQSMGANPSGIAGASEHQVSANATRYWLGLDENLFASRIAFVPAEERWGAVGLEFKYLGLGIQNRFDLSLAYAKALRIKAHSEISLGISGKWARNQYNTAEFHRFEDDPLFRDGDAADGWGLDLGAMFRARDLTLGVSGRNLISPSLSLSGEAGEGEVESAKIAVAGSYEILGWITPAIQIETDVSGRETDISGGLTANLLDGILALRAGYRHAGLTFGVGVSTRAKYPVQFDYAMIYPTGTMAKAGLSTHSVGIAVEIPRAEKREVPRLPEDAPDPRYADLIASRDPRDEELPVLEVGEKAQFRAVIGNVGGKASPPTKATVFVLGADSTIVAPPFEIPPLAPREIHHIDWLWTPARPGIFHFLVSANDDGSRFPLRHGVVDEIDVANNRVSFPVYVVGPISARVSVEHQTLRIPQLTFIADEEPLVPVVFFEKNGVSVAERFMPTLNVIAMRLDENPDIRLVLRGYADGASDTSDWRQLDLHISRAREVHRIIEDFTETSQRAVIEDSEYDPTTPRIRTLAEGSTIEDIVRAQQENRRVEMVAVVEGFEEDIISVKFPASVELPPEFGETLFRRSDEIRELLERNPKASLVFEGVVANEAQWSRAFDALRELRAGFLSATGLDLNYELFPVLVKIDEEQSPELRVYISGEGLIYSPKEAALAAKDFEIPRNLRENKVSVLVGEGIVEGYRASIVNQSMEELRLLSAGDGKPPAEFTWDWRDRNGNLVDPRGKYRVELSLKDPAGRIWNNYSPEIAVAVADKEIRKESTIIVQFAFDEVVATSKFLESRIESMARKIIALGQNSESTISVKILGHTDPIGSDRRNMILSEERAQKEEASIRRYLRHILDIDSDSALERWLANHRITLVRQGLSDRQPYEVERYREGRFERVLLGNNTFPEGRSANRRVIILIEEIRESN